MHQIKFSAVVGVVSLLLAAGPALAQAELPAKMQGKWTSLPSRKVGGSTIELVKMENAEKAQVKVTLTEVVIHTQAWCDFGTVETVAEKRGDSWQISVPHRRCPSFFITIKPVEAKQRFEGTFTNDIGGQGRIFYEW